MAAAVVGNSSSGIIEVPAFGIPTVNIGARQRGRLAADSVLNCEPNAKAIGLALQQALSREFAEASKKTVNPYGQGTAAEAIVNVLKRFDGAFHKSFHNLS